MGAQEKQKLNKEKTRCPLWPYSLNIFIKVAIIMIKEETEGIKIDGKSYIAILETKKLHQLCGWHCINSNKCPSEIQALNELNIYIGIYIRK